MIIEELLDLCEENPKKKITVVLGDEEKEIGSTYVEDDVCYMFKSCIKGLDTDIMNILIVDEAQQNCWYDLRRGSLFLDCEVIFVDSTAIFLEDVPKKDLHKIVFYEVAENEVRLICKE